MVNFLRIIFMVRVPTLGKMVAIMLATGTKIKCTGMVFLLGLMVGSMKESMWMIIRRGRAPSNGPMVELTMVVGSSAKWTAKAPTLLRKAVYASASGRTARGRHGLKMIPVIQEVKAPNHQETKIQFIE